jgi:hypothetical protein
LDVPEGYTAVHEGRQVVKAGDLKGSELWRRVTSTDAKTMMPPPETNKKLSPEQVRLLGSGLRRVHIIRNIGLLRRRSTGIA